MFEDLPYQIIKQPGSPTSIQTNTSSGYLLGTGTQLVNTAKLFTDGQPIANK